MTSSVSATSSALPAGATSRATPQGGIFDHANPSQYDSNNPLTMFIIQAGIIVIFCRLLHYPLSRIRQPRVISEVIGGILLGPSVMGRIPGFRQAIFPTESLPNLNLVANLGLVLFLFMIGVETDLRKLVRNWRIAVSVSAAGMLLPFALGCAVAYGLFHQFRDDPTLAPINFGTYMLFIGIAMAITAFPVLCRILTELELLSTNVGVIVLSAGVGNDVVGWILLALCVALVNASTGLAALWALLTCVGFTAFLFLLIRPGLHWILRRTGALHDGPNQSVVALILLMALASAFFTQIIGVHAIFGGFLVGLICPHEGGFAIKLTEKIEDLVGALFLPLYFALSGLNTNIGLLDNGKTWGYVVAVVFIAFIAKVAGGALASRLTGLLWRESGAVGVLMSCKGLVELIVLNIGLQAKILSTRTFTIFVVMALITTFVTTPLTLLLYPEWYRTKVDRWRRGEIDWDGNLLSSETDLNNGADITLQKVKSSSVGRLLVYLRLDNLPGLFTFVSLLGSVDGSATSNNSKLHHVHNKDHGDNETDGKSFINLKVRPLQVHGIRLAELTDRDSSVMKVSEVYDYSFRDPILNTFRTFGQLNRVSVSGELVIVPEHAYAETIVNKSRDMSSDFVLIPWSETGGMSEHQILLPNDTTQKFSSGPHSNFISNVLKNGKSNIGILVNNGFGGPVLTRPPKPGFLSRTATPSSIAEMTDLVISSSPPLHRGHHIFLPYLGGADDQVALRLVLQLAKNVTITATITYIDVSDASSGNEVSIPVGSAIATSPAGTAFSSMSHQERVTDITFFNSLRDSLPAELGTRVVFQTLKSTPNDDLFTSVLEATKQDLTHCKDSSGDLIVVGRNSGASSFGSVTSSFTAYSGIDLGSEARNTLGGIGSVMAKNCSSLGVLQASLLVVQAGPESRIL